MCGESFPAEKEMLRDVEAKILTKRAELSKFESEYREVHAHAQVPFYILFYVILFPCICGFEQNDSQTLRFSGFGKVQWNDQQIHTRSASGTTTLQYSFFHFFVLRLYVVVIIVQFQQDSNSSWAVVDRPASEGEERDPCVIHQQSTSKTKFQPQ